jgi:hypothetical protein
MIEARKPPASFQSHFVPELLSYVEIMPHGPADFVNFTPIAMQMGLLSLLRRPGLSVELNERVAIEHAKDQGEVREFVISGKAVFEFVIENQKDEEEVLWFINKFSIPKDEIYLI